MPGNLLPALQEQADLLTGRKTPAMQPFQQLGTGVPLAPGDAERIERGVPRWLEPMANVAHQLDLLCPGRRRTAEFV